MKAHQCYEFTAKLGKDGIYECIDSPMHISTESDADIIARKNPTVKERPSTHFDVNKVFFESYQDNLNAESNAQLKQAQEGLFEMQQRILDSLKRNW